MRNKKRNTGNIHLCGRVANCLISIGDKCNEMDKRYNSSGLLFEDDAYWAIPAIINISFACELQLKRLSLRYNQEKGGALQTHDLKILFDDLPEKIRHQAEDEFAKTTPYSVTLSQVLSDHANSFDAWRYIYEEQNQNSLAYIDNLLLATKIFQNIDDVKVITDDAS